MRRQTFLSKKYFSMLSGGTMMSLLVAGLLLSDALIAGIMLGQTAVAAVNLILPVYSLASFFGMVCTLGVPILYSNAVGAFQREEADRIFGTGAVASIACGVLLFLLAHVFETEYLAFYQVSAEMQAQASAYFFWMRFSILILPADLFFYGMVFADGDELLSTISMFAEAAGELLLSILLCRHMGTAGLGVGSLSGTTFSLLVCLGHFLRKKNSLRFCLHFSWRRFLAIVSYSAPDAGNYLFLALFSAGISKYVTVRFGASMLILVSLILFVKESQLLFDGIGEAITPFLSIYFAENCCAGVRSIWKLARKTAVFEGVLTGGLLFVFAEEIPRLFSITDPQVLRLAAAGLRMMSVGLPFVSLVFLAASYYLAAGRIVLSFVLTGLRDVAVSLPLAVLGGSLFGLYGMLAGAALSPVCVYVIFVLYGSLRYGRDNFPLLLKEREAEMQSYLFDFAAAPEEIAGTRNQIETILDGNGFAKAGVLRLLLTFEELFMVIHDKNEGKRVLCECSLTIAGDRLKLVSWDDGKALDLSSEEMDVDSLRTYLLARLLSDRRYSARYLLTMSFNRNMLELSMDRTEPQAQ